MSEHLLVAVEGPVARVTLNRPERMNALTRAMWADLGAIFADLSANDDLRCVVLAAAGGKAFSPGNDIAEFADARSNVEQARAYGAIMAGTIAAIRACRHPTVAQIEGICVGGGLEIAGCCDIRICGASSRFGAPVKRLGLVMSYAELGALVDLVGRSGAAEILFEGEIFGAERAKEMGIVNRVVPDKAVAGEVAATAARIAEGAPLVARWHKAFLNRLQDPAPLTAEEIDEGYACFGTEDFRIGYTAFLAKRKPDFTGR